VRHGRGSGKTSTELKGSKKVRSRGNVGKKGNGQGGVEAKKQQIKKWKSTEQEVAKGEGRGRGKGLKREKREGQVLHKKSGSKG